MLASTFKNKVDKKLKFEKIQKILKPLFISCKPGSFTCPFPTEGGVITGPHGGLSGGVLIGHCGTIRVGIEQEEWLEVAPDTFRCHIFPLGANLENTKIYQ